MGDTAPLQLRWSTEIEKLAAALARAQKAMGPALKDAVNPHFKSRYADLARVREASAPLHDHGIAILQPVQCSGRAVTVTTMLLHESGQWLAADCSMEAADAKPQTVGSCVTYARRYSLAGILAIAANEDDDGDAAGGRPDPAQQARQFMPSRAPDEPRGEVTKGGDTFEATSAAGEIALSAAPGSITSKQMARMNAAMGKLPLATDDARRFYVSWAVGRNVASRKELSQIEASQVIVKAESGEMPGAKEAA